VWKSKGPLTKMVKSQNLQSYWPSNINRSNAGPRTKPHRGRKGRKEDRVPFANNRGKEKMENKQFPKSKLRGKWLEVWRNLGSERGEREQTDTHSNLPPSLRKETQSWHGERLKSKKKRGVPALSRRRQPQTARSQVLGGEPRKKQTKQKQGKEEEE